MDGRGDGVVLAEDAVMNGVLAVSEPGGRGGGAAVAAGERSVEAEALSADDRFDPLYMRMALQEGRRAMEERAEVPVGCLLVHRRSRGIVGRGANRCNELRNATKHAELVSVEDAQRRYPDGVELTRLLGECDAYVTCEPCIMCTAALMRHGLGGCVYFGCRSERFGGCGTVLSVYNGNCGMPRGARPLRVSGGHFAQEAVELLRQFYEMENIFAPLEKRKVKRQRPRITAVRDGPTVDADGPRWEADDDDSPAGRPPPLHNGHCNGATTQHR